jgi:hypothetical protein
MVDIPTNPAVSAYNNGAVAGNTAASGSQNTAPLQGNFALDAVRQVERRDPQFSGGKSANRQQQPERFQDFYSSDAADYETGSPRGSYLNIVV